MSIAALLWALILALSAATSVRGMPRSMLGQMRDLHLPSPLMRPAVAWAHLCSQLLLAVGLVFARGMTAWLVGGAGVLLATIYLVLIIRARGSVCACLSVTPRPITNLTVLRNVAILVLAIMGLGWNYTGLVELLAFVPFTIVIACEVVSASRHYRA